MGFAGKGTGIPGERPISAKEAAGAKDVVPRTAIDLIRALPDSFSSGRSFPPSSPAHPFSPCCDVLLQIRVARGSLPVPAGPGSLVAFLFSTPLRAVPSLHPPFSALLLLHQRWQPAYRQSSFSILRGAAPPPPSLSLCPSQASSCTSATSAPFAISVSLSLSLFLFFCLRCVAP